MIWIIVLKLLVVLFFLVMFLRRPSWTWGVGVLTVASAILLDTFISTFNREEVLAQLGFFFYPVSGALMGGAIFWLLGLLRPFLPLAPAVASAEPAKPAPAAGRPVFAPGSDASGTAFDRQMIYEEIRDRLSYDDLLDLLFDLRVKDVELMELGQKLDDLVVNLMIWTHDQGKTGELALAVERVLTPPTAEMLPRREKINLDSPPTILRHYLLTHYDLEQLQKMAISMGIDWEQLAMGSKKSKVRDFLNYLYRRNRIDELIARIQETAVADTPPAQQ